MKNLWLFLPLLLLFTQTNGQNTPLPAANFDKATLEAQLKYLASDALGGRRTASAGEQLAAAYITEAFERYGVQPAPGQKDYLQPVPFELVTPPTTGSLSLGERQFLLNDNLIILKGQAASLKAPAVFAQHGWVDEAKGIDDYAQLDVKGKIVFVLPGSADDQGPMDAVDAMPRKQELAKARGALALIELYRISLPWNFFKSYFASERMQLAAPPPAAGAAAGSELLYGWIKEGKPNPVKDLEAGMAMQAEISTDGTHSQPLSANNIVGVVKGADPQLSSEYLLLSAHYDHVGIGKQGGAPYSPKDSIFNGARDNGMGVVALMAAAKYLSENKPKRSVLLLACTAEEMGMLGSAYYAEHPLVPLDKTVFNFNNDGAGYNSTKHVSVIGLGRTNMDSILVLGAKLAGLLVSGDPAPEQGLYERSDNISFAAKGIPAIDYCPGITAMDEAIFQYYHQASDNPDSIDYDYLLRFCQAYAFTARLMADSPKPLWTPGDKFERK